MSSKPDKTLAAGCGLFCAACSLYIATKEDEKLLANLAARFGWSLEEARCLGCRSDKRTPYCEDCFMMKCLTEKGIDFCVECSDYPCSHLKEFQAQAPHRLELWSSFERIKKYGWEKWYSDMQSRYSCPNCETINSAYQVSCRKCGEYPSNDFVRENIDEIKKALH